MVAKTANKNTQTSRVRKLDYKSKKKAVRQNEPIPSSFKILRLTLRHLWSNKRLFGGILAIYVGLFALLVKGLATNFQLGETRQAIEDAAGGNIDSLSTGFALFGTLVGTTNTAPSESGAVYQSILFVIMSLVVIWSLRQTFESKKHITISQAFYKSTTPLIPYLLTMLVVVLQLLPALIGSFIYSIVISNGIAVGRFEQILWLTILLLSFAATIFLVSSSLFATYIVTLPDITPMLALRKARALVKFRRFLIIRKLLFLPLVIVVVMIALFVPLVLYAAVAAEILFLVFSLGLLIFSHTYMYILYREML